MNKLCLPYNGMHSSSDMTEPQKRENPTYITRSDRRQWMLSCLGCVLLFVTLWTVAHQAPLSMKFSRQEHWSGLPLPPPGDLSKPGIEPKSLVSSALAGRFFITSATWAVQPIVRVSSVAPSKHDALTGFSQWNSPAPEGSLVATSWRELNFLLLLHI